MYSLNSYGICGFVLQTQVTRQGTAGIIILLMVSLHSRPIIPNPISFYFSPYRTTTITKHPLLIIFVTVLIRATITGWMIAMMMMTNNCCTRSAKYLSLLCSMGIPSHYNMQVQVHSYLLE